MKKLASRSGLLQAIGLIGYAAASLLVVMLTSTFGMLIGGPLAGQLGFDAAWAADQSAVIFPLTLGPVLAISLLREAWARTFTEVRLGPDKLEFDRFGSTESWHLSDIHTLRVTSQSASVHHVYVTEVSVCLTGPEGRRLHLTDLSPQLAGELTAVASLQMAERMLESTSVRFGPTISSHLNIYSLGPPVFLTAIVAAFDQGILGIFLSVPYFIHLYWKARKTTVIVSKTGLSNLAGQHVPWAEVHSVKSSHDELTIATAIGGSRDPTTFYP